MKTYKYTDDTNTIAHVIDEDGISRMSMLVEAIPPNEDGTLPSVLPADPILPTIPQSVTPRQARLALLGAGLLDQVETAIAAMVEPDKTVATIEWEYAVSIERNSQWIAGLGAALGLTDEQLDQLFITAATL